MADKKFRFPNIFKKRETSVKESPERNDVPVSKEKTRHQATISRLQNTLKSLTDSKNAVLWDDKENGWGFNLEGTIVNPAWPSQKWFLIVRGQTGGNGSMALHVDFGDGGPGAGYTASVYLLTDCPKADMIAKLKEPSFVNELYDDLDSLAETVRRHD